MPVIVAAGRLVPKKGFDVLLEAMAEVRRRRDVRLVVLGEGPERAALEARRARLGLRDVVQLAGFVDNPFAYLGRAGLFVLASFAEGSPNALIEAMACGCPVVATDCPSGPREILHDGRDGPLSAPGSAPALAAAIEQLLAAPPDRAAMRSRAADFDSERAFAAHARVLGLGQAAGQPGEEWEGPGRERARHLGPDVLVVVVDLGAVAFSVQVACSGSSTELLDSRASARSSPSGCCSPGASSCWALARARVGARP